MINSGNAPVVVETAEKQTRGKGRGSKFFALGRDVWERLWQVDTTNRLNLVLTHLVLLAGTGSDHRLTKWSAKACEQHLGMGKPRAKHAIQELIAAGLVKVTEQATRLSPQYELPSLPLDAEPIFLPVQLISGLTNETPVLRRIKEVGAPMLLRMLIDLYGLVETDATFGVPIANLRDGGRENNEPTAKKIASIGVHAVWAVKTGTWRGGGGDWAVQHRTASSKAKQADWTPFWDRVDLLKQIGALYYEPWLFDSDALDAEPLMPLDPAAFYPVAEPTEEAKLTRLAFDAARMLIGEERAYVMDNVEADYFVPLPLHQQAPALRSIAKLRVEADTPGRRLAWKRRRTLIERLEQSYRQVLADAESAAFNNPMRSSGTGATL